jgi:hypothetical protein
MRRRTLRTAAAAHGMISDDLSDRWIGIVIASVRGET